MNVKIVLVFYRNSLFS